MQQTNNFSVKPVTEKLNPVVPSSQPDPKQAIDSYVQDMKRVNDEYASNYSVDSKPGDDDALTKKWQEKTQEHSHYVITGEKVSNISHALHNAVDSLKEFGKKEHDDVENIKQSVTDNTHDA